MLLHAGKQIHDSVRDCCTSAIISMLCLKPFAYSASVSALAPDYLAPYLAPRGGDLRYSTRIRYRYCSLLKSEYLYRYCSLLKSEYLYSTRTSTTTVQYSEGGTGGGGAG